MGELAGEILLVTALLPLAVVGVLYLPRLAKQAMRFGPVAAVPALVVSLGPVWPDAALVPWLLLAARVELDQTGRLFLFVTAFVWLIAAVFATAGEVKGGRRERFFRFFYAGMAGNFLLIVAGDAITFMTGFAVMSYAGYGLVNHRESDDTRRAARIYLVLVVLAEVLLFAGVVIGWGLAGDWGLAAIRDGFAGGGSVAVVAMVLVFSALGVKAGLMPLHVWLPLAHPAAPVPASAVLSGAMIKAGLLGWIRFLPFGDVELAWLGIWAVVAGLVAAFAGVILGLLQSRPKTILAYSSISQMGYMTVLLGLAALFPDLYPAILIALLVYVVHHGVSKGALFLSVSVARGAPHRTWWAVLEGAGLVIPALALAGAPLTTGAVAKSELAALPDLAGEGMPAELDVALVAGAVATTLLMLRFLWVVWPRSRRQSSITVTARAAWLLLATTVLWGPWLVPWEHLRRGARAVMEPTALWSAFWPILIGCALSWVAFRHRRYLPLSIEELIPPGDLVVPMTRALRTAHTFGHRLLIRLRKVERSGVNAAGDWVAQRRDILVLVQRLEHGLKRQAWDWVWILFVAAAVFAALLW